jgi:hypothetical protein
MPGFNHARRASDKLTVLEIACHRDELAFGSVLLD